MTKTMSALSTPSNILLGVSIEAVIQKKEIKRIQLGKEAQAFLFADDRVLFKRLYT